MVYMLTLISGPWHVSADALTKLLDITGENINDVKEVETSVAADGTSEVKLTPQEGAKEIKDEEYEDPLKKPLLLDDGRWAVFSW